MVKLMRFERQVHILAVIGIYAMILQVVHFYKRQKSGLFAPNFVWKIVFHEIGQFQNLMQLRERQEVKAEKKIYKWLFHLAKLRLKSADFIAKANLDLL